MARRVVPVAPTVEPDSSRTGSQCDCTPTIDGDVLVVDATACDGTLASSPSCREAVVRTLVDHAVDDIVRRRHGRTYRYGDGGVALLLAAARFVDLAVDREPDLAALVARDPLAGACVATGRGSPGADVAAVSGLALVAARIDRYEDVLALGAAGDGNPHQRW